MRFVIETERLILRNLTPADYEAAFKWCGDPDVARYMVYPVYTNAEAVKSWLESLDPDDPDEYEAGIVLRSGGELIGSGSICYDADKDIWIIGYNLRKDQWGNGYALEMMKGLLRYVGKQRTIRGIEARFANENSRSRRVMEKLGMTFAEDAVCNKLDGSMSFPGKLYRRIYKDQSEIFE